MAQEHINLGTAPAGTDGDTTRVAMQKCEDNFNDLYGQVGANAYASFNGFKNKLINGAFDVWQRGGNNAYVFTMNNTGTAALAIFVADRWQGISQYANASIAQGVFALGDSAHNANRTSFPANYMSITTSAISDNVNCDCRFQQRIEDVRLSSGKTFTVSMVVYVPTTACNIGFSGKQNFGTGGSPSVQTNGIAMQVVPLAVGWNYVSVTMAFPDITGKTLGTGGNSWFSLDIHFAVGTGLVSSGAAPAVGQQAGTWYLSEVQMEEGTVATKFERRPFAVELLLCQRYYNRFVNASRTNLSPGLNQSATAHYTIFDYPVPMRAPPAVTVVGTWRMLIGGGAINITGFSVAEIAQQSATIIANVASGLGVGQAGIAQAVDGAGTNAYVEFSAEL